MRRDLISIVAIAVAAFAAPVTALGAAGGFVRTAQSPAPKPTLEAYPGEILSLTDRYFAALDRGATQLAFQMMHTDLQAKTPFNRFQASEKQRQKTEGPMRDRKILQVRWSESAGGKLGVYASVDYAVSYRNSQTECGVVVWAKTAGGAFTLVRHDRNMGTRAAACSRSGLAANG